MVTFFWLVGWLVGWSPWLGTVGWLGVYVKDHQAALPLQKAWCVMMCYDPKKN